MTPEETSRRQYTRYLDWISSPEAGASTGSSGAMAGALAASMIASVCLQALDDCKSEKAEDELRLMHDKALSLRRDLLALVEHGAQAASVSYTHLRAHETPE